MQRSDRLRRAGTSSLLHLSLLLVGAAIGGASAGAEPTPRPAVAESAAAGNRGRGPAAQRDQGNSAPARSVELELKERTATGVWTTFRATLGSAVGDPGQLALETGGGVFYKLKLRRDHRGVLYLDLDRGQRGPGGSVKLQSAALLDPQGKRALLAKMARPDSSALEVTAALR